MITTVPWKNFLIVNHPENKIIEKTTFKKKKQSITSDTVLIQSPITSEKVLIHSPIHHNILNINPSIENKKDNIITKNDDEHLTINENK